MQSSTSTDDSALLARLRARDDSAYEQLVRAHGPRLLAVARRMLGVEEDARDAVQEAFINAFRSIDAFERNSTLSTWLHRIVINAALMKLRTRRRKPEHDIDALLPAFRTDGHQVMPSVAWSDSADDLLERKEIRDLVRDSIARLPDPYRVVLQLREIEELSTEEVASLLDITPNAVKIRLHRARQALRSILDPHLRHR